MYVSTFQFSDHSLIDPDDPVIPSSNCETIQDSSVDLTDVNYETVDAVDVQRDPALWPANMNKRERDAYLQKDAVYFQNKNSSFITSKRQFKNQNRYFSSHYFYKKLQNGEQCERKWIMFSESTGSIFCYFCKIFSTDLNHCENSFVKGGFSNWKKAEEIISSHENSKEHNKCTMTYITYSLKNERIDTSSIKAMADEVQYWYKVLKRVVSVVRFLGERGLPFRGSEEKIGSPNNGNFLGIIELIAEYDPFLEQHIKLFANKGRGNVSYLSKTIFEEFVEAMAKKILQYIIREVQNAKYWGLILDSTPDISHVDQLSVVFRYYLNSKVYERFFCFLQIKSHKGRSISDNVLDLLAEHEIKIENCRAQTYDNARNMSGKYNGLQACICEKNKLAFYVPCTAHSLNLVGECSVGECINAINFFGVLQQLYTFFSASTHRWGVLEDANSNVKSLSKTRWSRRSDACKSLNNSFDGIYNALKILANDKDQKPEVHREASVLMSQITKLENAFMTVLWNCILNRFDGVSQYLQKIDIDLISASQMLFSLVDFVQNLRNKFSDFEAKAKQLSVLVSEEYADSKKRKITKRLTDGEVQASTLSGSDKFRIETYYIIIDKLVNELRKRSEAYNNITQMFGFLLHLLEINEEDLKTKVTKLVEVYADDLNNNLFLELEQFISLLRLQPQGFFSNRAETIDELNDKILNPLKVLNWLIDLDMVQVFPNVYIAYRLLLTIPIANCETERSFSVLKRIKNMYRSTMENERLSSLSRLSIERELLRSLDFDDLIEEFAQNKSRKKFI